MATSLVRLAARLARRYAYALLAVLVAGIGIAMVATPLNFYGLYFLLHTIGIVFTVLCPFVGAGLVMLAFKVVVPRYLATYVQ